MTLFAFFAIVSVFYLVKIDVFGPFRYFGGILPYKNIYTCRYIHAYMGAGRLSFDPGLGISNPPDPKIQAVYSTGAIFLFSLN